MVDPVKGLLVDAESKRLSGLEILFKGEPVIDQFVMSTRLYIWNSGNSPLLKSEILEPIRFEIREKASILDTRILVRSRSVTGIDLDFDEIFGNTTIDFSIMEPEDGAAIQVIYAGPKDAAIEITGGSIIGVKEIKSLPLYRQNPTDRIIGLFFLITYCLLLSLIGVAFAKHARYSTHQEITIGLMFAVLSALTIDLGCVNTIAT